VRTPFDELTKEELDEAQRIIGRMILNLPLAALRLDHVWPADTIRGNYLAFSGDETAPTRVAKQYIIDLFTMKAKDICAKWGHDRWPTRSVVA
jgi:hypothetical protein